MKFLQGSLEIRNLELVKGKEVAKLAYLYERKNLFKLELRWGYDDYDIENCDAVLEGLEPHPNLRELVIIRFGGVGFPRWFGKLSALVELQLWHSGNCTELPSLGQLPFLEILEIKRLKNVCSIGQSFYNDEGSRSEGNIFPALKRLVLAEMKILTKWEELKTVHNDSVVVFPNLGHLVIDECSQLAITPTHFPSLNRLVFKGDVEVSVVRDIIGNNADFLKTLILRSIGGLSNVADVITNHLTALEEFVISDCHDLIDVPSSAFECCKSLESFNVRECSNLVSCPLNPQQTPSLSFVNFEFCPSLFITDAVMPRGFSHLTKLRDLSVGPFSDDTMKLFDWSGLVVGCSSTLQKLQVDGSGVKHSLLPEQLQHFASIEILLLRGFGSVEALPDWFGNLASLQHLCLTRFPSLQYLPSEQVATRLSNMERLVIADCPLFEENWAHKTSFEWSTIFGRPNVDVKIY